MFYECLYKVVNNYIPVKKGTNSRAKKYNYPSWFTPEIIKNIGVKYYNLKKFKSLGLEFNRELYRYYRSHVKELIKIQDLIW